MNLTSDNKKRRIGRVLSLITIIMVSMPAIVLADATLDDAVCTANKSVSAPAAMVMFIALLVMCFICKKFYKK